MNTRCGIVEFQRIGRLNFDAADSGIPHELEFSLQLLFRHGGAEPPPTHHDPAIVRRVLKRLPEITYGTSSTSGLRRNLRTQKHDHHHEDYQKLTRESLESF